MSTNRADSAARATTDPGPAGLTSVARRLAAKAIAGALLVALTLFHGWLLEQRIADLTLLEPLVALRWVAAAVLLVGVVNLRRAGISLVWGRRALVLWLLVLVLHAGSVAEVDGQLLAEPGLLLALPFWAYFLQRILGARAGMAGVEPRPAPSWAAVRRRPNRAVHAPWLLAPLAPRPPPVRSFF